jgi:hypothetical protein
MFEAFGTTAPVVEASYTGMVVAGQKAAKERLAQYQAAYAGRYNIVLPTKIRNELADLGIKTNMSKPIVDALCAKLDLHSVTSPDATTQRVLDAQYQRNSMDEQSVDLHKEMAVNGDAYVLVWPEIGPDMRTTGNAVIRLLQAEDVDLRYDEGDLLRPSRCSRRWSVTLPDGTTRIRRDTITNATILREYADRSTGGKWAPYLEDGLDAIIGNMMGVIPIVHFRAESDPLDRPFGISQLEAAIPIVQDIQAIVKDCDVAAYYNSGRQIVVTGVNKDAFDHKNPEGLDRSAYSAHMWPSADVKEFAIPGDDMTGLRSWLQDRIKHLAIVTRTPLQYLEAGVQNTMSGIALQQLEQSLQDKVKEAQTIAGNAYRRMFTLAAQACNIENAQVTVTWEQPYEQDTTERDLAEYKAGLITAKEYHMRRGLSQEAAQQLADDIAAERAAESKALFGAGPTA